GRGRSPEPPPLPAVDGRRGAVDARRRSRLRHPAVDDAGRGPSATRGGGPARARIARARGLAAHDRARRARSARWLEVCLNALRRLPFFYGWVVVTVAFVTMGIGVNVRTAFS